MSDPSQPLLPVAVTRSQPPLPAASEKRTAADMAATAREFEGVFMGQMAKIMLESVEQSPEFSGGQGEAMFRGIMAEKIGSLMAERGGIGLAPAVLEQMIRLQGGE